jgi:two-component system, LytTR family, response regulator
VCNNHWLTRKIISYYLYNNEPESFDLQSDMIKAVIIEDENICTEVLKKQLSVFCPEIELAGEFKSGNEAHLKLPEVDFDLLFLDIDLGDMTAFDLLGLLPGNEYHIIFTTTFPEYALNAIKANAIDYLVKPVDGKELRIAVNKAMEKMFNNKIRLALMQSYREEKNERLMVSDNKYWFIEFKDILLLQADGRHTQIHYLDSQGDVVVHKENKLLRHFEDSLQRQGFIRIHKSYLINRKHISAIIPKPPQVVLTTGRIYDISRDRKSQVFKELSV